MPVDQDKFVLVADQNYTVIAPANSPIRVRTETLLGDEYTELIVTGMTGATNGIVAAWRRAGASNFVGIFDAKTASPPRLDWQVDLPESTAIEAIAVSDDGNNVAMVVHDKTGCRGLVATKGGSPKTLPDFKESSPRSLVWYKSNEHWRLAINYEAFAIVQYDTTSGVISVDNNSATLSARFTGMLCDSNVLIADAQFDKRINVHPHIIRIVPREGGSAARHRILHIRELVPQAVVCHCSGGNAAFMCRCLGPGRRSAIILGILDKNGASGPPDLDALSSWKLYLRRSGQPIVAMADHREMGCFVTQTDGGFAIETLPWDEEKLEELCSRGDLERIEQD